MSKKSTRKKHKRPGQNTSSLFISHKPFVPAPLVEEDRQVIGEGTYGCVHKPSLECENPPISGFNYDGIVSKLMPKDAAEDELAEFEKIDGLDPDRNFHLGKPEICVPKASRQTQLDVRKCNSIDHDRFRANPNNYRLLLMKNGGPNFEDLKDVVFKNPDNHIFSDNSRVEILFEEMRKLLEGVKTLRENGLIHHDLKPGNILMNMETGKLVMIDFGILVSREDFKARCLINENDTLGIFHWNFPLECAISNKRDFDIYVGTFDFDHEKLDSALYYFLAAIFDRKITEGMSNAAASDFRYGLDKFFQKIGNNYDVFMEFLMDSIDIYGLGMSLCFLVLEVKKQNEEYSAKCERLISLFRQMCLVKTHQRLTNINEIIRRYDGIINA